MYSTIEHSVNMALYKCCILFSQYLLLVARFSEIELDDVDTKKTGVKPQLSRMLSVEAEQSKTTEKVRFRVILFNALFGSKCCLSAPTTEISEAHMPLLLSILEWHKFLLLSMLEWHKLLLLSMLSGISSCYCQCWSGISSCYCHCWSGISSCYYQCWSGITSCYCQCWRGISSCYYQCWSGISSCYYQCWSGISSCYFQC